MGLATSLEQLPPDTVTRACAGERKALEEPAAFRKRLSRARAELTAFLAKKCSVHTAGATCACHKQLGSTVRTGQLDPAGLSVRIGDLLQLRVKLAKLEVEDRTTAILPG